MSNDTNIWKDWYGAKDEPREASTIEIITCLAAIFSVVLAVVLTPNFGFFWVHVLAIFFFIVWVYLRSSRKDMNATAALFAGFFGGGAVNTIVIYLLLKYDPEKIEKIISLLKNTAK